VNNTEFQQAAMEFRVVPLNSYSKATGEGQEATGTSLEGAGGGPGRSEAGRDFGIAIMNS